MSVKEYAGPSGGGMIPSDVAFAHEPINIAQVYDREYLNSLVANQSGDATLSWTNYRRIGEVRYAIQRSARIAGSARLVAAKVNEKGQIVETKDRGVEADIVSMITSRFGGTRGLIERYYTLMNVPGQSFFTKVRENRDGTGNLDGYWFLSASEIAKEGDVERQARAKAALTWTMRRAAGANSVVSKRLIRPEDFLGRVWAPDHQFVEDVNSPMEAINPLCEQLHTLNETLAGRLRQRFALAGILLIPNEISDAAISGDEKARPRDGLYSSDKVMNYLIHVMTTNVINHAKGLASIPILLKGPAAVLDKVRHMVMDVKIFEEDLKHRAVLIESIFTALNQQKQSVTGGEDTSHWCVDEETEALTQRGWLRHDEIEVGDMVLTLNHETGASEWQPVQRLYRANVVDEEMVRTENGAHSSLTTLNHRWPVWQRTTENMVDGMYRRWRTSETLNTGSAIIAAAPSADQPVEAKWSDDLVELVAWMWTEGSFGWREGRRLPKPTISQSNTANPNYVARIERTLRNLYGPPTEGPMPSARRGAPDPTPRWRRVDQPNGMAIFKLNGAIGMHLHAVCPNRIVDQAFIRDLTPAQLELFIAVSVMADGTTNKTTGQRSISQADPARLDAVELAAILAGYRVRHSVRVTDGFTPHAQHTLHLSERSTFTFQKGGISRERYTGIVWCPSTANTTWMARRDGQPFFTGNSMWAVSDEERRITVQPELDSGCHALTRLVLWPELQARGRKAGSILPWRVWYDLSAAQVRSNQGEDARQGFDRMVVSGTWLRNLMGATDEDAPTEAEYVRQLGVLIKNPILATYGLEGVDVDWDRAAAWGKSPGPTADSPADDPQVGPGVGDPGSPDDRDSDAPRSEEPG